MLDFLNKNEIPNPKEEVDYLDFPESSVLTNREESLGVQEENKESTDDSLRNSWENLIQSNNLSEKEKQWGHDILTKIFSEQYLITFTDENKFGRRLEYSLPENKKDFDNFLEKIKDFDNFEVEKYSNEKVNELIQKARKENKGQKMIDYYDSLRKVVVFRSLCDKKNNIND